MPQALAQNLDTSKVEAERIFKQGEQQLNNGQPQAALKSLQQALLIYQQLKERLAEGHTQRSIGNAYYLLKDYPQAIAHQQQALIIGREIKNPDLEARALLNLGLANAAQGNTAKAIDYYQQTLKIVQGASYSNDSKNQRHELELKALSGLANIYVFIKNYPKAFEYLEKSLVIVRNIQNKRGELEAIFSLGQVHLAAGNNSQAIRFFQQALAIAKDIKDPQLETAVSQVLSNVQLQNNPRKLEADRLFDQGMQQFQTSQFPAASKSWEQALLIYREIKDRVDEVNTLINLGYTYSNLGNFSKAIQLLEPTLAIAREINDRNGESKILRNLGTAYLEKGDYLKAIDYSQQSLNLARETKDREGEGQSLGNLGLAYTKISDYPKAISYHQQSLAIAQEVNNLQGVVTSLTNLGNVYLDQGAYKQAIELQQQGLAIVQDPVTKGKILGNLGNVYFFLGEYQKAVKYHEQSLKLAREINNLKGQGQSLGNLAAAYLYLGYDRKAIDYQKQSLAIAKQIEDSQSQGNALANLGDIYTKLGDYAQAINYHQQHLVIAQTIKDRKGESVALGNLGLVYSYQGNYPKAIDYSQQSLAITQEIKDSQSTSNLLNNLGFYFYKQGNLKLAESTLIEGMKVRESLRAKLQDSEKISIFDTQLNTYRALQQVLIAQNKTDVALEIAERGRARAFVELLSSRISSNPNQQLPSPPKIAEIKQIAKTQNATLVQYSIVYDDFNIAGKIEFKESELYIWVIQPTGELTFRKVDLKPLWQKEKINLVELVYRSRETINVRSPSIEIVHTPNQAATTNQLKKLHQLLLQPIADLLPEKESDKVIFIPQSSLFLVPFPALQDENGKYLIEKHTILTSPSIQVLDLTRQQRKRLGATKLIASFQKQDAVVVGNPTMPKVPPKIGEPPQQLLPLPSAEAEAKAIAPILKTQAITGDQATKSAILQLLSQARIIHLATHGLLDDIQGLGSAIALAPSGKDNGLLTAEEIFERVKLNAELVVLSACDTGRGRITGDGIIGLSRSLISAGTPSVIVSLWPVPDAPTAELMTEFYQNLQKSPDKAIALRTAMLATMKQHPEPKNWAAFTLIGEAD
ncbi:tetratricopeptide repeat protein [Tolypothrix tenuis]|uniref:tetratricopeptide repeat protein n=1 Tax=Tolypothrix tenuis TaxID=457083 RepID=UPI0016886A93